MLLSGPVEVFGLSYGASMGPQLPGHDRRVGAVIALEPFGDARRSDWEIGLLALGPKVA